MTTTQLDGAVIAETRGNSSTQYVIRGALQPVLDAIRSLFINYNPLGYGTHLHSLGIFDGEYAARISRLNSCD